MFKRLRTWFENRRIKKMGFTESEWESAVADWPVVARYKGAERDALRDMTLRFLVRKNFASGSGFQFNDAMCLKIATMACVPVLHLGLDWYDHIYSIILYEGDFVPNRPYRSDDGVVHAHSPGLSGEAWLQGPLILSWQSVCHTGPHSRHGKAANVVIHEFAHKLDMLRDGANGAPPMHPDMKPGEWHDIFSAAWERLQSDSVHHRPLPLDGYSLTSPAEFFAVCSETFFEDPETMKEHMPKVYRLLCQFYRQTPC
ncbi:MULTISPECIES: zinc-dependent peptidase [Idiomarina]|jgi:Mlc titration factor MtfA (ptsG expression regulator)|uniref:M90 family metallopeptidase n=1 Tax=Idiomarina TaxID=135575 RepID=UPI000C4D460D|nr:MULTISPECIES: M90 family metallopeptidase [Idiomarina]MBP58713.1 Zn-dependent hydrolase [Idiomarina sp.]|tara:strand:+ start:863 stop:1630 length:768 start_codon:yes stop_codon:yes gene_type:complete